LDHQKRKGGIQLPFQIKLPPQTTNLQYAYNPFKKILLELYNQVYQLLNKLISYFFNNHSIFFSILHWLVPLFLKLLVLQVCFYRILIKVKFQLFYIIRNQSVLYVLNYLLIHCQVSYLYVYNSFYE
jgi:hypothetical protein